MEQGSIEREIHVDATIEVVYEVITQPEHIVQWWGYEASFPATPGGDGQLSRGGSGEGSTVEVHVVEADPPRRFVFRWLQPEGQQATPQNSFLVTFDLAPAGDGTRLRFTESGFREVGWEAAQLEEAYRVHGAGWDHYLPMLAAHATGHGR